MAAPQGAATPFRADGGHCRLARGNAPQGAAPLSRHSPTAPLPGEPLGRRSTPQPLQGHPSDRQPFVKPPLQGEVSPKVTEGCIAAHPYRYPLQDARKARRGCTARCRTPGSFAGNAPIRGQGPHLNFSFLIPNSRKTAVPGPRRKARPGRFVISRPTPHPQATGGTHHAATLAGPRKQSGRQPRQRL